MVRICIRVKLILEQKALDIQVLTIDGVEFVIEIELVISLLRALVRRSID